MKIHSTTRATLAAGIGFLALIGVATSLFQPKRASASTATWPQIEVNLYLAGFELPTFITNAHDGSGRLFVVEQAGRVQIIANGSKLGTPFLDITARVRSPLNGGGNEEGLLSIAFPPDFPSHGHFYVYYTDPDGNNRVSRFQVTNDPNVADPASEAEVIRFDHPGHSNHNGGQLAFGADGYLYIGTGDGGGGGDPQANAQNPASLLGKILRIDVSQTPPAGSHNVYLPCVKNSGQSSPAPSLLYRIPPDNPFVNQVGYRPEIWALGVRNPWRFSFDHQTGDLYIADVGQNAIEEVNFQLASSAGGENYGWNVMEGSTCYNATTCDQTGLTLPVAEYSHSFGCSITGGYVYRGVDFPALRSIYFYGDFCSGRIWGLQNSGGWQSQELLDSPRSISSFGEDEIGEIYLADLSDGGIYRLTVRP